MICHAIPYEGKEPYLFISYCHTDRDMLYPLFEQMASEGCRLWYDDGNHPGDDWVENIENHLELSNACLAFISASSSLSHNCKREIIYALKCRKKVIPVLIEDVELPKGLRMQLVDMHYLKRWDYPSDRDLLKKLIKVKEIEGCNSGSSAGLLRPDTEVHSPKQEEPLTEKKNSILSQLLRGNLKPKSIPLPQESAVVPLQEQISAEAEDHPQPITPRKVRITPKRIKPEPEAPVAAKPEPSPDSSEVPEVASAVFSREVFTEEFDSPEDKTVVLSPSYQPEDEDKTVVVPRFSPALLLCPGKNRGFVLSKPQVSLGRSPIKCDVVIEGNSSISKHHADIIMVNGKYYLSDAGSTNGTFLNGKKLEPGKQAELESTAVFILQKELMVFFSGPSVNQLIRQRNICFLMNEDKSSVRIIDQAVFPLDRTHRWPDGTLSDQTIHRNAHASVRLEENGCILKDENSKNGTRLNGVRLNQGASASLSSGDQITLGQTTLCFYSIPLKGENQ